MDLGLGLFLIPILAGYWLLTHLNPTRYIAERQSGYHVFFEAGVAGVVLFVSALVVLFLAAPIFRILGLLVSHIRHSFGLLTSAKNERLVLALAISLVLGFLIPLVVNLVIKKEDSATRAAKENGDLIELLIAESIKNEMLVELSMSSGKSYIGFALDSGVGKYGESDISLIPVAGGFRDKDTQKLTITDNYATVVKSLVDSSDSVDSARRFRVVIPMSQIILARTFDPEIYIDSRQT